MSFLTESQLNYSGGGAVEAGTGYTSNANVEPSMFEDMDFGKMMLAGGTLLQSANQIQAGRQAADVAGVNAGALMDQAGEIQEASQLTQTRLSERRRKILGKQIAAYGKAGVELSGSPLQHMIDTAEEIEKDIIISGYEGAKQVRKAAHKAKLLKWRGEERKKASYIRAGTTLLSGASKLMES